MERAEMSGLSNKPIHGKGDPNSNAPGDMFYDGWSNIKVGGACVCVWGGVLGCWSNVLVGCVSVGGLGTRCVLCCYHSTPLMWQVC